MILGLPGFLRPRAGRVFGMGKCLFRFFGGFDNIVATRDSTRDLVDRGKFVGASGVADLSLLRWLGVLVAPAQELRVGC